MQKIPTVLIGRDILASGQTGSGKTASFLIPIISHCCSLSQCYEGKNGPYAIILTPTRELCYQIENLAKRLAKGLLNMKTALLVGGLAMPNQDHIRITVGVQQNKNENLKSSFSNSIPNIPVKQTILWVENKSKKKQLFSLLNDPKYYKPPIVIFVESKTGADLLSQAIEKKCN